MGLLSWPVIRSIPCPLANLGLKQTFPRQRGLILLLSVRRCCRLSDDNNSRSQRVIGLCALLLLYLAEGNAKGDSGGRHEWKTPGGMQYTHACTSNTAASTSLIFLYSSTFLRTRRHKRKTRVNTKTQTSILLSMNDVTELCYRQTKLFCGHYWNEKSTNSWLLRWTIWLPLSGTETLNVSCPILKEFIFIKKGIICNQ